MPSFADSRADVLGAKRQLELYRTATPTQKLAVVARLNGTLLALKEAELQERLPGISPTERRRMLRRWWMTAHD